MTGESLAARCEATLERLRALRSTDAPVRGGRVLSYVYDPGVPELDALTEQVMAEVAHLNGLDPLTFASIATMEREITATVRDLVGGTATGGPDDVVGTVTSGGTESSLLAVWTAHRLHPDRTRVLAPSTVHPATVKAAHYLGLIMDVVPCDPATGTVVAEQLIARIDDDVVCVVLSAPSYPYGALDPIAEVAARCAERGVDLHVDACFGGLALPLWPAPVTGWDLSVPGVSSLSVDLHKFGYATKGASVLLHRGRDRHRAQYFAHTGWPGYPVVTSTSLGSRSATGIAVAWAQLTTLGPDGLRVLMARAAAARDRVATAVAGIDGLTIVGRPVGPMLALTADAGVDPGRRVDPHQLTDELARLGWFAQSQPGLTQTDGTRLPASSHLTFTPVLADVADELVEALVVAADAVRGRPPIDGAAIAAGLGLAAQLPALDSAAALGLLSRLGVADDGPLGPTAGLLALLEAVPAELSERLLVELLARRLEPAPTPAAR